MAAQEGRRAVGGRPCVAVGEVGEVGDVANIRNMSAGDQRRREDTDRGALAGPAQCARQEITGRVAELGRSLFARSGRFQNGTRSYAADRPNLAGARRGGTECNQDTHQKSGANGPDVRPVPRPLVRIPGVSLGSSDSGSRETPNLRSERRSPLPPNSPEPVRQTERIRSRLRIRCAARPARPSLTTHERLGAAMRRVTRDSRLRFTARRTRSGCRRRRPDSDRPRRRSERRCGPDIRSRRCAAGSTAP